VRPSRHGGGARLRVSCLRIQPNPGKKRSGQRGLIKLWFSGKMSLLEGVRGGQTLMFKESGTAAESGGCGTGQREKILWGVTPTRAEKDGGLS